MNHPIYDNKDYAEIYNVFVNDKSRYNSMLQYVGGESKGLEYHIKTMHSIANGGHVLIDVKSSEWESEISKKTISSMKLKDIHLPFVSGAIIDKKTDDGVIFFYRTKDSFNVSYSITQGGESGLLYQTVYNEDILGDRIEKYPDHKDEMYRTLSVLMYIAAFKREKSRVKENTTNKLKASKKRSIPSHRIHTVFVRQPKTSRDGAHHSGHSKSNMSWIVKGHWRNQWYASLDGHKPKWIDPYTKGKGKEELSKIYKVS